MKHIQFVIGLLLFVTNFCLAQTTSQKAVIQAFENYKSSIIEDRGEEAVKYVDSRTIKYYDIILELVKNADSVKISSLSLLDKLMVFSVRHRTSKENILSFDGKQLLVYAIKSGMVGKSSVANNSLGDVAVDKDFAKAQFVSNGKVTPFYIHFYKEEQQWKMDLTSIFDISNTAFTKVCEQSGQPENEYLFTLLEMITGKKVGPEIWQKVN
ncbi:MAG: hypothetical protein WBM13_12445 [Bacteroidia bacterium]